MPSNDELLRQLQHLLRQLDWMALLDIGLVAVVIYYLLVLVQGTRATQLLKGLLILLAIMKAAQWLGMDTLQWILGQALFASALVVIILFQPELRAALDQLGRHHLEILGFKRGSGANVEAARTVSAITKAAENMSLGRIGALIVIARETGLEDIVATGTPLNASLSEYLIQSVFFPGSPMHDGAAIIRNNRLAAAGCILPLSQNADLPRTVGTRHRAALGLSETTDAIVIVVSEESGNISLAHDGTMNSILQPRLLADELLSLLDSSEGTIRLRPFARRVGSVARSLPATTWGTLRAAIKKS